MALDLKKTTGWVSIAEAGRLFGKKSEQIYHWCLRGFFPDEGVQWADNGTGAQVPTHVLLDVLPQAEDVTTYENDSRYMRRKEAADYVGISVEVLHRWYKSGLLTSWIIASNGKTVFIEREALDMAIETRKQRIKDRDDTREGRTPFLTTPESGEAVDKLCKAIEAGNFWDTASAFAGLNHANVKTWLHEAKQRMADPGENNEDDPYIRFYMRVDNAERLAEARMLDGMQRAGAGDWRQYESRLKLRFPGRYAKKTEPQTQVNIQAPGAQPTTQVTNNVQINANILDVRQLLEQKPEAFEALAQLAEMNETIDAESTSEESE